jgi:hypothetical protein
MDPKTLSDHFRVTAFVDILGWSSLTKGIDSLTLRRMKRDERLSQTEREDAARLCRQVEIASHLDNAVRKILEELEDFAVPERDVEGLPDAKAFWENRHVTFVRSSDSIFLHSSHYRWIVAVVSELFKRGLSHGIMFRAGISCGVVIHFDRNGSPRSTHGPETSRYLETESRRPLPPKKLPKDTGCERWSTRASPPY